MKDGGPAFPLPVAEIHGQATHSGEFGPGMTGMSLRDYFASKAMAGMLGGVPGSHLTPLNCARSAYEYADAMLSERERVE